MFAEPQRSKARKFEGKFNSLLVSQAKWSRRTRSNLKAPARGDRSADNFSPSNYLRCGFRIADRRPR